MRRKSFVSIGMAIAILVCLPVGAYAANTIKLAHNTSTVNGYSWDRGGEFQVYDFSGMSVPTMSSDMYIAGAFQTFCIEKNEFFSPGAPMTWVLNREAVAGGNGSDDRYGRSAWESTTGDPISPETAYLYTEFWFGRLSDYDYSPLGDGGAGDMNGRIESARELQKAIWYLEDETDTLVPGSQAETWVNEARNAVTSNAWSGIGHVRVLNLYDLAGNVKQDQLVMVPLPLAAPIGLVLLAGLGVARRVRRRR